MSFKTTSSNIQTRDTKLQNKKHCSSKQTIAQIQGCAWSYLPQPCIFMDSRAQRWLRFMVPCTPTVLYLKCIPSLHLRRPILGDISQDFREILWRSSWRCSAHHWKCTRQSLKPAFNNCEPSAWAVFTVCLYKASCTEALL